MRRDRVTLDVADVSWVDADEPPVKPRLEIDISQSEAGVQDRLRDESGALLEADELDFAYRLQSPLEDADSGVVGVTNRLTGSYILELNESPATVLQFIKAARHYGEQAAEDAGEYGVDITLDGEALARYDKQMFLVYDDEGNLLRQHSLIPGGVEL
ncbi:MAG: DUF5793 family protein [Natrialbaceae archaeon]|nr:DUF5793 family protein [Natrialbaceae archaeon]